MCTSNFKKRSLVLLFVVIAALLILTGGGYSVITHKTAHAEDGPSTDLYWGIKEDGTYDDGTEKKVLILSPNSTSSDGTALPYSCSNNIYLKAPWVGNNQITEVKVESDAVAPPMKQWFYNLLKLRIADLSNLNTFAVTDMSDMFRDCRVLESLDLSTFDTSNVTTMNSMFIMCRKLNSLVGLNSFDTSSVTDMRSMFDCCNALESLDLSSFDTSDVTAMGNMFYFCKALTSLDLSSFDTSSVTTMSSMFMGCSSLTSLDLSSLFKTSNVKNMMYMFYGCSSLTSLDLSSFDTTNVTNADSMFSGCDMLNAIKTPKVVGTKALSLPARFMYENVNADGTHTLLTKITSADANQTIVRHATCSGGDAPTCIKKSVCEVCGNEYGNFGAHDYGDWIAEVSATCTATGTAAHKDCGTCNKHFDNNNVEIADLTIAINPDAHDYDSGEITTQPTCMSAGVKTFTCTRDGTHTKTESVAIVPTAHSYGAWQTEVPATCVAMGTVAHKDCLLCHKHFDNDGAEIADLAIAINPAAHDYDSGKITLQPTCTSAGVKTFTCTRDGTHTKTESVAIVPTAHAWNGGEVTTQPTCITAGVKTFTCTHDDTHIKTESVAALGHSYGEWIAEISATATENGTKGHKDCSVCNKHFDTNGHEITDLVIQARGVTVSEQNDGLSGGGIAGISIGVVLAALIIVYIVCYFVLYRKGKLLKGKAWNVIYKPMNAIFNKKENS